MPDVICALDGCEEIVPEERLQRGAKYHADGCRKKAAGRRWWRGESNSRSGEPRTLDERVSREKEKLRQTEMRRTLEELTRGAAKRKEYTAAIKEVLTPFEPSEVFPFPEHDTQTTVEWVLPTSDWHVGQRTLIETTEGVYEQTLETTRRQVDKLIQAVSGIFHESRGKHVKRIWMPILGDITEGDSLRPSQLREIQIPVVKQVVEASDLLSYYFRTLLQLPGLEELIIDVIPGNHERTTTKAGNAGLAEHDYVDSYAWLMGAMLSRQFADDPRVSLTNHESFFGLREFGGLRHVFEHGSSIRSSGGSYGGIPFYPIINAARQWESQLGGVDMVFFGHLHIPYRLPLGQQGHIIGNGSLPATSRFVQSRYKVVRRPQQWLIELHREHGVTACRDLYADIDLLQPGEIWDAIR